MHTEPVRFIVTPQPGVDAQKLKDELEALTPGRELKIHVTELRRSTLVTGITNQHIYEKLFGAKLEYQTKTVPNLNGPDREVQEWVEKKPATIPDRFVNKIASIKLVTPVYLTD